MTSTGGAQSLGAAGLNAQAARMAENSYFYLLQILQKILFAGVKRVRVLVR
jgi:hypothetical protein